MCGRGRHTAHIAHVTGFHTPPVHTQRQVPTPNPVPIPFVKGGVQAIPGGVSLLTTPTATPLSTRGGGLLKHVGRLHINGVERVEAVSGVTCASLGGGSGDRAGEHLHILHW